MLPAPGSRLLRLCRGAPLRPAGAHAAAVERTPRLPVRGRALPESVAGGEQRGSAPEPVNCSRCLSHSGRKGYAAAFSGIGRMTGYRFRGGGSRKGGSGGLPGQPGNQGGIGG